MIMVEEGTTNLLPRIQDWIDGSAGTATIIGDYKVQIAYQGIGKYFEYYAPVIPGLPYFFRCTTDTGLAYFYFCDSSKKRVSPWYGANLIARIAPPNAVYAEVTLNSSSAASVHTIENWQFEQKAYSTSFHPSTRSAESLTIPTAGLTPGGGTIEGIFECNEMAKRTTENQWNNIFDIPTVSNTSGIMVWHNSTSWILETRDDSGTSSTSAFISDSLTPDGPIGYRVSWSPAKARLEFWSVENDVFKTLLASAEITNPKLPSAFASNMYIGSQNGSVNFLNTSFGRHRLSNIVRTDVPDLIADSNTIAVLSPTYDFLR